MASGALAATPDRIPTVLTRPDALPTATEEALADIATKGYRGYFEFEMFPEQLRGRSAAAVISAVGKQYARLARP